MDPNSSDEAYQEQILQHVSRTFALTIPQLPPALRLSVTNAYLLCRIADTIEDQTASSAAARLGLLHRFVAVLCGGDEAAQLARDVLPRLSEHTLPAERELILNMRRIVRLSATLPPAQRTPIERCVGLMCDGMHQFQCVARRDGLDLGTQATYRITVDPRQQPTLAPLFRSRCSGEAAAQREALGFECRERRCDFLWFDAERNREGVQGGRSQTFEPTADDLDQRLLRRPFALGIFSRRGNRRIEPGRGPQRLKLRQALGGHP